MVRDYHAPDGHAGWAFSIRRDGMVCDARRDLYAHAFVLLAIAAYVDATGERQALAPADETLTFIERRRSTERRLRRAAAGGRRSPAESPYAPVRGSAGAVGVFRRGPLSRAPARSATSSPSISFGIVGEYFTETLAPAPGIAGRIVEPGHHYEWSWLLRRYERAGREPIQPYVDAPYTHADRFGFDEEGLIVDELLIDGSPHRRSRRIWPAAEAIKANLAEARLGRPGATAKGVSLVGALRARFLASDSAGGWLARRGRQVHRPIHARQHALPPGRGDRRVAAQRRWPWSRSESIGFWIGHQMPSAGSFHSRVN